MSAYADVERIKRRTLRWQVASSSELCHNSYRLQHFAHAFSLTVTEEEPSHLNSTLVLQAMPSHSVTHTEAQLDVQGEANAANPQSGLQCTESNNARRRMDLCRPPLRCRYYI